MTETIWPHVGAGMTALWGIAHLFPTRSVVAGFGEITPDNKRIIAMEWILEGVSLIFIGTLVSTVTVVAPSSEAARAVYLVAAAALLAFAIVSLFTGYRVNFFPFKLCPIIFGISAALIVTGAV